MANLEQTCAVCGRYEAAGAYCSGCLAPTRPEDTYVSSKAERDKRGALVDNPRLPKEERARIHQLRQAQRADG